VFDEIVPIKTTQLIQDVFGNYVSTIHSSLTTGIFIFISSQVIQKLLDFGTQAQKDLLVVIIEQNVVPFSLQIYGCRVVQKVIQTKKLE
jgi:pumilio RNA-binding family